MRRTTGTLLAHSPPRHSPRRPSQPQQLGRALEVLPDVAGHTRAPLLVEIEEDGRRQQPVFGASGLAALQHQAVRSQRRMIESVGHGLVRRRALAKVQGRKTRKQRTHPGPARGGHVEARQVTEARVGISAHEERHEADDKVVQQVGLNECGLGQVEHRHRGPGPGAVPRLCMGVGVGVSAGPMCYGRG